MFYAIKHKPTGLFLPVLKTHYRAGHTHAEPTADRPPRLFTSERNAKLALKQWLQGPLTVTSQQGWGGDYDEVWSREKHSRRADDMAIVEIEIQERLVSVKCDDQHDLFDRLPS